jgi:cytidylate kinase
MARQRRAAPRRRPPAAQKRAPLVITIDGPAGAGKSTVAKLLAKELGLTYLDTGATYRALAFAVLQERPEALADEARLALMARGLPLELKADGNGALKVFLAGLDITRAIRSQEISEVAAQVSQYPEVRAVMVEHQRKLAGLPALSAVPSSGQAGAPKAGARRVAPAGGQGVVVEGRDTGSVVFPDAPYKFFLDADVSVRAARRQRELSKVYGETTPLAQIREELHLRDLVDRSRPVGPLVKPHGAVLIETSQLTARQVMRAILTSIRRGRSAS